MAAEAFTAIFLAALVASLGVQLWLGLRQIAHVRSHRDNVPEAFRESVGAEAHRKAADYTVAKTRLNLVALALGAVLLLIWTLGGGLDLMDRLVSAQIEPGAVQGAAVVLGALILMGILDLPLSVYATFGLEQRFGFNRTTPLLFMADLAKSAVLGLAVAAPLVYAILRIMAAAGNMWWLYAWAVWIGFAILQTFAYPRLIAPLFNRFTPLADDSLRARVERLAQATGFAVRDVFVMDGSKRSAHGNAYMTGFGASKRIVFFDTLLSALQPDEVEAVLAHELGHYRLRHILKKLVLVAAISAAGWALLGWLSGETWFYAGLGISAPSDHMALLLFLLAGPVFAVFLRPVLSRLSRKYEFEADAFAKTYSDARALASGLVKLYRDNANTLTPDPLYSAFYHSHPPPAARIRELSGAA